MLHDQVKYEKTSRRLYDPRASNTSKALSHEATAFPPDTRGTFGHREVFLSQSSCRFVKGYVQQMIQLEPGKFYHLYTRGNNKETLFRHPDNYHYFLQLYRKYLTPYADTFAYCLLPKHVHFLVRIKDEDALKPKWLIKDNIELISINRQLGHLLNAYAKTINLKYDRVGRLFQHRFGRKEVSSEAYFTRLVFYIHFNPQHHGLIEDFSNWPYSSYHSILSEGLTSLQREEVLEWFGGRDRYKLFHTENAADFSSIAPFIEEDKL